MNGRDVITALRQAIVEEHAQDFGYVKAGQTSTIAADATETREVFPLRHQSPIGIVYGSGWWHGDVLTTAAHVPDGDAGFLKRLIARVSDTKGLSGVGAYALERPSGTAHLYIDGAFADALLVGTRAEVEALKADCPTPREVENMMGWPGGNPVETAFDPVVVSEGFPAGDQQGEPERRYLSRYTRLGPPGGLYAFYTSLEQGRNLVGDTLGGTSGGRQKLLATDAAIGITVRAGPSGDQYITVGQPLTSEMRPVQIA